MILVWQGRNPYNFLFAFWEKLVKATDFNE